MKVGTYTASELSNEAYHASEGVSSSVIKTLLAKSPAHTVARSVSTTRAMEIGTAIHAKILEPERFDRDFKVVECDTRTSALYKSAIKDMPSSNVLTAAEYDNIEGMFNAARANKSFRSMLDAPGKYEHSIYAKCPETGLLLKCRFDKLLDSGDGFDLKKTQDCSTKAVERSIWNYGYHISAAFYDYVYFLHTGSHLNNWYFGWLEEKAPHAARVTRLPDDAMEEGFRAVMTGLKIYADCLASGDFFAYGDDTEEVGLPAYAYSQLEDDSEVSFDE